MNNSFVVIDKISKNYGSIKALNSIELVIEKGEFFSLLGSSGSGKTTLLRILSGFEKPTSGKIYLDGKDITDLPPYKRPTNLIFQSYALFPHMSVFENVAFGLNQEGVSGSQLIKRVEQSLDLVQMLKHKNRMPGDLSGGQKQRVAIARSLVKRPKVLLLDEPMAALDKRLRDKTQFELINIQEEVGITFIMVTHDQKEAMTMSSRIAIMEDGEIMQVGSPKMIYEFPNNKFVADFVGSINFFEGTFVSQIEDIATVNVSDFKNNLQIAHTSILPENTPVIVAVRPEKVLLSKTENNRYYNIEKGVVKEIAYLGDSSSYYVKLESGKIIKSTLPNLKRLSDAEVSWDDEVYVYWNSENCLILQE